jgi:hypothetical protein
MKIGIITLPLHVNYGGILQAYALQTVLERMGHEVEVIDRPAHEKESVWVRIKKFPLRLRFKLVGIGCTLLHIPRRTMQRSSRINPFIQQRMHIRRVWEYTKIRPGKYDAFVVGSDQVWRLLYNAPALYDAYLQFAKGWNVKRVAYAVSLGETEWNYSPEQTAVCRELIKDFDAVSVREDSAVALCRDNLGVTPLHVLDPTLLLTQDDYLKIVDEGNLTTEGNYLLAYLLNPSEERTALVSRIAQERGMALKIIALRDHDFSALPSVDEWLNGFSGASFVITDSFHACVFSLIFNKPFVAFGYDIPGVTRMQSLLNMLGLQDHLLGSEAEYDSSLSYRIKDEARRKLESNREDSIQFLKKTML